MFYCDMGFPGGSDGKEMQKTYIFFSQIPAMQKTWVQSLGWKNPLEKDMATNFSILA